MQFQRCTHVTLPKWLAQEKRKRDQNSEEADRQDADAFQVSLDVGVIGIEFRCHIALNAGKGRGGRLA